MKMNLFRRNLMRFGFGQSQRFQRFHGPRADNRADLHSREDRRDIRGVTQGLIAVPAYFSPPSRPAGPVFRADFQAAVYACAGQSRDQRGKINAQMAQGGKCHVAADAVRAIKIDVHILLLKEKQLKGLRPPARRPDKDDASRSQSGVCREHLRKKPIAREPEPENHLPCPLPVGSSPFAAIPRSRQR